MQPPSGIDEQYVIALASSNSNSSLTDFYRDPNGFAIGGALIGFAMEPNLGLPLRLGRNLFDSNAELLDCGGPLQVSSAHQDASPILAKPRRKLSTGRRLACALQPAHHDDRRPWVGCNEMFVNRPHEFDEFAVVVFDHLLSGPDALEHFFAKGFLLHLVAEVADDVETDVGIEQRSANLRHGVLDVGLGNAALPREAAYGAGQAIGEIVKHEP
jgi:hypothetical protein